MSLYHDDDEDVEDEYVDTDEPDSEFMPIRPMLCRFNEENLLDHALKRELGLDTIHYDFDGREECRRAYQYEIYDRIMGAYRLGTQARHRSCNLDDSNTQSGTSKVLALLKRSDAPELLKNPEVQDRIKEFIESDEELRKKLFRETLDKLKGKLKDKLEDKLNSEVHLKEIATKEIQKDMAESNENEEVNEIDVEGIIDCLKDLPTVLLNDIQMKVLKIAPENILCLLQLQFYGVVDVNYSLKGSNKEVNPLLLTTMGNKLIKSISLDYVEVERLYRKEDYDLDIGDYLVIDTYYSDKVEDTNLDLSLPRFYRYSEAYFNRYFGKQLKNSNTVEDELTETTETPNEQPQDNQGGFSWL